MIPHILIIDADLGAASTTRALVARIAADATLTVEATPYEAAIAEGQQAVADLDRLGRGTAVINARYVLAQTYRATGRYEEAVQEHQRNIAEHIRRGQLDQAAYARQELEVTLREAGRYEAAIAEGQQAVATLTQLGREADAAYARRELGVTLREAGRYEAAIAEGRQAIDDSIRTSRPLHVLWARNDLAQIYRDWGHFDDAITQHLVALKILQFPIRNTLLSDVLFELAVTYRHAEQWEKAEETLKQCLILERQLERAYDEATVKRELCVLYREWGLYDKAEEFGLTSLSIGGALSSIARCHEMLGRLYQVWRKPDQAIKQAHENYFRLHDEVAVADTKIVLAKVYADQDELDHAADMMLESLASYRHLNRQAKVATALRELGQLYCCGNRTVEGLAYLQQSLKTYTELDIQPEIKRTEAILGALV